MNKTLIIIALLSTMTLNGCFWLGLGVGGVGGWEGRKYCETHQCDVTQTKHHERH